MKKRPDGQCDVMLERLSAYLDGDLPAGVCREIERHAEGCLRCSRVLEDLRETVGICHRAASAPLPGPVKRRARARVRRLLQSRRG